MSSVGSSKATLNTEKGMTERCQIKISPNSIFSCCGEARVRADLEKEKRWFVCTHAERMQTKGPRKKRESECVLLSDGEPCCRFKYNNIAQGHPENQSEVPETCL